MVRAERAGVRGAVALAFAAGVAFSPARAGAEDTKRACARSAETGQRLRDEGKPLAARAELLSCGRQACPSIIRAHCAKWLEQIDSAIPTVVFRARSGAIEVTDVAVTVDGVPMIDALDGQPHRVEPGSHTFRYTHGGAAPIESRVLLVAGEKNRLLAIDLPSDTPTPPPPMAGTSSSSASDGEASHASGGSSIRPAAWVFASVAVVGAASFAYFGATGKSDLDSLRATCAGHCAQSDVSSAWNRLIVADASLAVGVVSAGIATWLFATPRHAEPPPAVSGLTLGPTGHGASVGWHGVF